MSDKIRQLIRFQWKRRHSRNPLVRAEARNLVRAHVSLLRTRAQEEAAPQPRVALASVRDAA